jgi:hypothetical protein
MTLQDTQMNNQLDELLKNSAHRLNQHRLVLDEPRTQTPVMKNDRMRMIVVCMVLFLCILATVIPFSSQVRAYVVNLLGTETFQQVVEKGLSIPVGQGSLHKGIQFSVENLYVDQKELVFDMVQAFTEEAVSRSKLDTNDIDLWIDGKKVAFHSGGEFRDLGDGRYGGVVYYHSNYGYEKGEASLLPERFLLTIQVNQVEDVQGTWSIELPVSRERSDHASRIYEPRFSHEVNGIVFHVARVEMMPLSTTIDLEMIVPEHYSFMDPSSISLIQVNDDKGYNMGAGSARSEGEAIEGGRMKYRFKIELLKTPKEMPEELVIIPQRQVIDREDEWVTYFRGEALEPYIFHVPLRP